MVGISAGWLPLAAFSNLSIEFGAKISQVCYKPYSNKIKRVQSLALTHSEKVQLLSPATTFCPIVFIHIWTFHIYSHSNRSASSERKEYWLIEINLKMFTRLNLYTPIRTTYTASRAGKLSSPSKITNGFFEWVLLHLYISFSLPRMDVIFCVMTTTGR